MEALLRGEQADVSAVLVDMEGLPGFDRRVYEAARRIPPGSTSTYGAIAAELGHRAAARDVGQALGNHPFPILLPCHRILAAGGKLGGFSARGGSATKRKMLAIENVRTGDAPTLLDGLESAGG